MKNKSIAIGTNICKQKLSYFREVHFCGAVKNDAEMGSLLKNTEEAPIMLRNYSMYHDDKKFCVIQEYFSETINKILSVSFK
jgi:chorismate-pyruvate lyase